MEDKLVWVSGSYDSLLNVLFKWYQHYDKGRVVTYRKVYDGTEQLIGLEPRERELQLEITDQQFSAVVKLMSLIYPRSSEASFFKEYYDKKFKKCKRLRAGQRLVPLVVPKHVVKGILDLFIEFKSGRLSFTPRAVSAVEGAKPMLLEKGTTKRQGMFAEVDTNVDSAPVEITFKVSDVEDTTPSEEDALMKMFREMEANG